MKSYKAIISVKSVFVLKRRISSCHEHGWHLFGAFVFLNTEYTEGHLFGAWAFRTRISRITRICAHMFAMFKGVALYATNIRRISDIRG